MKKFYQWLKEHEEQLNRRQFGRQAATAIGSALLGNLSGAKAEINPPALILGKERANNVFPVNVTLKSSGNIEEDALLALKSLAEDGKVELLKSIGPLPKGYDFTFQLYNSENKPVPPNRQFIAKEINNLGNIEKGQVINLEFYFKVNYFDVRDRNNIKPVPKPKRK